MKLELFFGTIRKRQTRQTLFFGVIMRRETGNYHDDWKDW